MSISLTGALAFAIYAPILYHMVLHWHQVDDYSHGFLIGPLAVYFAWERRAKLRRAPVAPSWWGALPLALGLLSLTVGRLGVELMTMRAAFVLTLNGLVLLLLGRAIYRILAFPLLFLFLAVPLPQSLVNVISFPLQLLAADLAVSVLQLFGTPILREGNIIHLPTSQLFVADACSGLRSLMALGTLGVVFAYFFRKNPVERAVIVASTLRDPPDGGLLHLRAGLRGAARRSLAALARVAAAIQGRREHRKAMKLLVALTFLALNFYVYHFLAQAAEIPARDAFESFPMAFGDWRCDEKEVITADILENLGATDYLVCSFYRGSEPQEVIGLYVGYHEAQVREEGGGGDETSIHPPAHCLPGSGWDIIDSRTVPLGLPELPQERPTVKRLIVAKGEARQLVYYWYQSRGRVIADDWQKILYVGWDRATRSRTDGSLVRFTVLMRRGDEEAAEAAFLDLAPRVLAVLSRYVPE